MIKGYFGCKMKRVADKDGKKGVNYFYEREGVERHPRQGKT